MMGDCLIKFGSVVMTLLVAYILICEIDMDQ